MPRTREEDEDEEGWGLITLPDEAVEMLTWSDRTGTFSFSCAVMGSAAKVSLSTLLITRTTGSATNV